LKCSDHVSETLDRTGVDEIGEADDRGLNTHLRERAKPTDLIFDRPGVDTCGVLFRAGSTRP
jgi:hypothetical protein